MFSVGEAFLLTRKLRTITKKAASIFGSLHNFHVVHCTPRNYTWKAGLLCAKYGVGHYIENYGVNVSVSLHNCLCNVK